MLDADFAFELTPRLAEVVANGVPLYFRVEFELTRPRWYWFDETAASRRLQLRLSYHALSRHYRLSTGAAAAELRHAGGSARTCSSACATGWWWSARATLSSADYEAAVRMRLDAALLPKPFQLERADQPRAAAGVGLEALRVAAGASARASRSPRCEGGPDEAPTYHRRRGRGGWLFSCSPRRAATPRCFAQHYPLLLGLNAALAALLAALVVVQLVMLVRRYRARVFGSRLTLRLLVRFAVMAVVPGLIVYTVSVQFLDAVHRILVRRQGRRGARRRHQPRAVGDRPDARPSCRPRRARWRSSSPTGRRPAGRCSTRTPARAGRRRGGCAGQLRAARLLASASEDVAQLRARAADAADALRQARASAATPRSTRSAASRWRCASSCRVDGARDRRRVALPAAAANGAADRLRAARRRSRRRTATTASWHLVATGPEAHLHRHADACAADGAVRRRRAGRDPQSDLLVRAARQSRAGHAGGRARRLLAAGAGHQPRRARRADRVVQLDDRPAGRGAARRRSRTASRWRRPRRSWRTSSPTCRPACSCSTASCALSISNHGAQAILGAELEASSAGRRWRGAASAVARRSGTARWQLELELKGTGKTLLARGARAAAGYRRRLRAWCSTTSPS